MDLAKKRKSQYEKMSLLIGEINNAKNTDNIKAKFDNTQ